MKSLSQHVEQRRDAMLPGSNHPSALLSSSVRSMVNVVATFSLTMSKPLFSQRTVAGLSDVVLNVWLRLKKMLEPSLRSSVKISDDVPFDVLGHAS